MELAAKAADLFKAMEPAEKREILGLVLSNSVLEEGTLRFSYKKPFDLFVNVTDLAKWRGGRDLNPRPPA